LLPAWFEKSVTDIHQLFHRYRPGLTSAEMTERRGNGD
jgi:hypothetical protein